MKHEIRPAHQEDSPHLYARIVLKTDQSLNTINFNKCFILIPVGKKKLKAVADGPNIHPGGFGRHLIALSFIAVAVVFAYSNSLNGTWALDDTAFRKSVSFNDIHDLAGNRKISYFTFFLNQTIGSFSPASFRSVNIFIHIVNSALVYMLAFATMGLSLEGRNRLQLPFFGALFSGIIFGLHPININAVAYIVQRMSSLATLFVLLSLLCYIGATRAVNRFNAILLYLTCIVCVIAGILSKENAVMAIPLIFLYDYIFLARFNGDTFRKRAFIGGGAGVLCFVLLFLMNFQSVSLHSLDAFRNFFRPFEKQSWMAADIYWTPYQHILTEFRVIARYLSLIFLPLPKLLIFDYWGLTVSTGIIRPVTTLLSMLCLMGLFMVSVWKIKRWPLLSFGVLWYLISISLESFLVPGLDLYFEHRNYMPFSGLVIGLAGQGVMALKTGINEKKVYSAAFVLCLVLAALTFSRNFVWKDSMTLWKDTLGKDPSNIRAMLSLGSAFMQQSDMDNAEKYYNQAVKAGSDNKRLQFLNSATYSLGMIYLFRGDLDHARQLIEKFDKTIVSYKAKIMKGFYKALSNDPDGALSEYDEVLKEAGGLDRVVTLTLIGDAYREKGALDRAAERYEEAISLDRTFASAYYGLGEVHMSKRELELADKYFRQALLLDPENVLILSDVADLLLVWKSRPQEALVYAQKAVSKPLSFYKPYLTMANVLVVLGREQEAEAFYEKALALGMSDYMVPFSKARAYYVKGEKQKTQQYISELLRYRDLPDKIKGLIRGQ